MCDPQKIISWVTEVKRPKYKAACLYMLGINGTINSRDRKSSGVVT